MNKSFESSNFFSFEMHNSQTGNLSLTFGNVSMQRLRVKSVLAFVKKKSLKNVGTGRQVTSLS